MEERLTFPPDFPYLDATYISPEAAMKAGAHLRLALVFSRIGFRKGWVWFCSVVVTLAISQSVAWGQWGDPLLVDSNEDTLAINTVNWNEWCPFISADGQYLYFAREGPLNNDLFVCHRDGENWSTPLMLPFCQPNIDERNPAVNATNDTLYFISIGPGWWDIFWCFRTGIEDTAWSQPEAMPASINSGGIEFSLWITPDNQRLLFSSWRPEGNGGEDIYECRRDASTETGWATPQILSGAINSWASESYPSMGSDTTELFFWRDICTCLVVSSLTDSGWQSGQSLADNINRPIGIGFPSEITPCITPDGGRLYFSSHWGEDSTASNGDIWYAERTVWAMDIPSILPSNPSMLVYPSPFNSQATLTFQIPRSGRVEVTMYDVLGRAVKTVAEETMIAGEHRLTIDGADLPTGLYFVRVHSGEMRVTQKILLLR